MGSGGCPAGVVIQACRGQHCRASESCLNEAYLPHNRPCRATPPIAALVQVPSLDPADRSCPFLDYVVPTNDLEVGVACLLLGTS